MYYNSSSRDTKIFYPKSRGTEAHLPHNNSLYASAKRAHVIDKDLKKAEYLYLLAIKNNEKVASSIKDLSNIYHQQGRTHEALTFLESHRHLCKSSKHIDNLIETFKKQIVPTGNYLNKTLVLFNVPSEFDKNKISRLFENSSRIEEIAFIRDHEVDKILNNYEPLKDHHFEKPQPTIKRSCLIRFSSNSAARKTLDTLIDSDLHQFYWLNEVGKLVRKAEPYKKKPEENSISEGSSEDSGDSFILRQTNSKSCWSTCLYPGLDVEEKEINYGFRYMPYDGKACPLVDALLRKMDTKFTETRLMIDQDPNFVKKLLNKVILDELAIA